MNKPLITPEYLGLNKELHERKVKYGGKGDAWTQRVAGYITENSATSYLDYGCGKKNLLMAIGEMMPLLPCAGYDPVTAPDEPEPADFVTCNDVLEHIEPDLLNNVLEHLMSKVKKRALLVISQRLANKTLADGRNAHLIVKPNDWWIARLKPYIGGYQIVDPIKPKRVGVELAMLVSPG